MLWDVCMAAQRAATRGACLPLSLLPLPFAIAHIAFGEKYNYGAMVCKQGKGGVEQALQPTGRQANRRISSLALHFFSLHLLLEPWAMGLHGHLPKANEIDKEKGGKERAAAWRMREDGAVQAQLH